MNIKQAYERLNEIHEEASKHFAKGNNNPFNKYVHIIHQDGSTMFYYNSFAVHENEYWFILTEHHNAIVYHQDEVEISQYERIWDKDHLLPWKQ